MGLLESLKLNSDFDIEFTLPTCWQRWFGEYKGGTVEFIVKEKYQAIDHSGLDWELLDAKRVFDRFSMLQVLAEETKERGNDVNFIVSFCQLSIKFKNIQEAVWFRMNL